MRYRPKRENYAVGQFGEIDYQEMLERYCTYLENQNKQLRIGGVSKSVAQEYAEFCVRCNREGLPLLELDGYIKQYCG